MEIGTIRERYNEIVSYEAVEKLKQLIKEHPDYPIVVLVGEDTSCDETYWTYAGNICVAVDEILDCNTTWWESDYVCTDREEFEETCKDEIWERLQEELKREPTDEELETAWQEVKKAHEPY